MSRLNPVLNCLETVSLLSQSYYSNMGKSKRRVSNETKRELAVRLLQDDDVDCYEILFLNKKKNKNLESVLRSYVDKEITSFEALDHIFDMIVSYHDHYINDFFKEIKNIDDVFDSEVA